MDSDPETTPDSDPAPTRVDVAAMLPELEALASDLTQLDRIDEQTLNRLRKAAGLIAFPDRTVRRALGNARRRREREKVRDEDDRALNATSNRATKRALRFPVAPPKLEISARDRELLEQQAVNAEENAASDPSPKQLLEPARCYICKEDYRELHPHYDSLCPTCATINWEKRQQSADLTGRTALVTGARVKIGYEASLMLLRAGARLIASTRFPCDAAKRFAAEADFERWEDRLHIFGLDLRHTPSVEAFAAHLADTFDRLDFLIHNACQTVRRPPAYSAHLMEGETVAALDPRARALLRDHETLVAGLGEEAKAAAQIASAGDPVSPSPNLPTVESAPDHEGLVNAAAMSQLDLLAEASQAHLFPEGMLDGEGQQLDLRRKNSWRMELSEVPTVELIEVQLVNAVAPFVLTARLKPLMARVASKDKHVVNVSAMEGQFYRTFKTTRHPHTNMAKAALNMMTRTSAADYLKSGIHMNSVDTGWVTDEDPFAQMVEKESAQRFAPPLDSVDGAARVLDPIFTGFNTGVHCWGQFLKDYEPTRW